MVYPAKTVVVTGASQGIGAGVVRAFLEQGYNIVANSRSISASPEITQGERVAVVEGDIGDPVTAANIASTALARFGSIDVLVNNAGRFFTKPFLGYSVDDFRAVVSTNLEGFLHITQHAIRQMRLQETRGAIVTITAALVQNPNRSVTASVPMITKGGLETVTRHLAMEYAKDGIRVNAIAPGVVATPLHRHTSVEAMSNSSPMGRPPTVEEIAQAAVYLVHAPSVTGTTLYVDGGSHLGRW